MRAGDRVIATCDIGHRIGGKFVPQGSQGVVLDAGGWAASR